MAKDLILHQKAETDQPTNRPSYREARTHLKRDSKETLLRSLWRGCMTMLIFESRRSRWTVSRDLERKAYPPAFLLMVSIINLVMVVLLLLLLKLFL